MESSKKTDCVQQLNTKGCCFLCLETEKENRNIEGDRHLFSIRCLLQHLQITTFDHQIFMEKDIKVDLCETCENTFKGFTAVLEELEKVQMKMNYFLERINKTISSSKKDSERGEAYSKKMTDDPKTFAQFSLVNELRMKLAVKSLAMQVGPIPCIKLERTKVKKIQVKKEVAETEEFSETAEDIFDNGNQNTFETEIDLPSLEPPPEPIKQGEEADLPTKETKPGKLQKSRSFCYKKIAETGMFECTKCDKTYRSNTAIYFHYQSVHLKKRFKCEICNIASYVESSKLKLHQKTCRDTLEERLAKQKEREEFKFVCDLCGKRFRCNSGLTNHRIIVHKNINRHACNLCDKKYTTLSSLKEHKNAIHFGKLFYCRFCKKEIRRKTHVYKHEKICDQKKKINTELE